MRYTTMTRTNYPPGTKLVVYIVIYKSHSESEDWARSSCGLVGIGQYGALQPSADCTTMTQALRARFLPSLG